MTMIVTMVIWSTMNVKFLTRMGAIFISNSCLTTRWRRSQRVVPWSEHRRPSWKEVRRPSWPARLPGRQQGQCLWKPAWKPELDGEGGILFPALSIPDENPSLILLWPMCTLTGIARRGAIATWRRRRRRRNEQSWMKNIQERVFPLVRHLKGFVCADGMKIDNRGGGELGLGGCWCW